MDQIVTRESMRQRGAEAFNAGRDRDSHNMNPWALALVDWLQGYDRAALRQNSAQYYEALAQQRTVAFPQPGAVFAESTPS